MRRKFITTFLFALILLPVSQAYSQTQAQIDSILAASDTANLTILQAKYDSTWQADKTAGDSIANAKGMNIASTTNDSARWVLQWIGWDSIPVYARNENVIAAQSIGTDKVHAGGGAGLSLDGSGFRLAQWDGGQALPSHAEYTGRVTNGDGDPNPNFHATHVAGTMIASGVDADAKGMAPAATLTFYNFNNDGTEMTAEANSGLILSNHSYGFIRGWATGNFGAGQGLYWFGSDGISATEDFRFGFYSGQSRQWDVISNNAPFYLIVKSAGNDRGEGPSPGTQHFHIPSGQADWVSSTTTRDVDGGSPGFDCLGEKSVAKNILTVGAVNDIAGGYSQPSDVVATSFTGFGPCDDGRIKPDIVANGTCLKSAWDGTAMFGCTGNCSGQSYCSISGTSMSAPSVTGSAVLLQQHYSATHNSELMRSSTLKGLIIHTADEAGTADGPDYKHGWGLMNTAAAAALITEDVGTAEVLQEITIGNGSSYTLDFTYNGTGDPFIKATIAWNDPAATPVAAALDPSNAMLVNDMDLRITRLSDSQVNEPWTLDKNNPSNAATTGDNTVDNVEQVYIDAPQTGNYRLTIDHKGTLSTSSQVVSVFLSGLDLLTGNEKADPVQAVRIYPHPITTNSVLEFRFDGEDEGVEVGIFDLMGKELERHQVMMGLNRFEISADRFEDGVYFYRIGNKNNILKSGKFIVADQ